MDKLKAMETFVRVARSGSFARAADQLEISRSQVTKYIQYLEGRFEARLFNRTTRQVALTDIGTEYLDLCLRILGDLDQAERALASRSAEPSGSLKIVSPMGFGNLQLAGIVADFMILYPRIEVAVVLNDVTMAPVEMIDGNVDLAIQTGRLADSAMVTRKVGTARWVACAAPAYLDRQGRPQSPGDLAEHNCLVHRKTNPDGHWRFSGDEPVAVRVNGTLTSNSVSVLRAAALAGNGLAILPLYCVRPDLEDGRLEQVLAAHPCESRAINVFLPHSNFQPRKVRLFMTFLAERLRDFE